MRFRVGDVLLTVFEHGFSNKRPDENNVLPYLHMMGALKDAVDTIERNQLRSCDKALNQMVQKFILSQAMRGIKQERI